MKPHIASRPLTLLPGGCGETAGTLRSSFPSKRRFPPSRLSDNRSRGVWRPTHSGKRVDSAVSIELYPGYTPSGKVVTWSNTDNPHLYLSGRSGTGKSFLLKKLVIQAVEQGALVLVPDYTCDFLCTPGDGLNFQRIDVTSPSFTLDPLVGPPGQNPDARAQQLLAALHAVFCMGSRATVALRHAAAEYLAAAVSPTLTGLLDHIYEIKNPGQGLEAAKEPLELLTSLIHCGGQPMGLDLDMPGLIVLDFCQIADRDLCKLLVELLLQAVWTAHTAAQPPLILVLDECQRLSWGSGSMAIRILREGRKFNIGGWFSSQWLDQKDAAAALGQAAIQAYFRPDGQHIYKCAQSLCQSKGDLSKCRDLIRSLRVGEFLWQQSDGKPVKIIV